MERTTLYFVTDEIEVFNQLKELVETNDDKEGEIVGTEDGTVRLFHVAESVFKENGLKPGDKALFLGDIKQIKDEKKKAEYVFEKYGVKYGWSGPEHAFIEIDDKVVSDKNIYLEFLKELSELPVLAIKTTDAKKRNKFGKFLMTFVVPFGFAKTIANAYGDSKTVKKQLGVYAAIMFYYNHLQDFMELELDEDGEQVIEYNGKKIKKKNKLDVMLQDAANSYNGLYNVMKGNGESLHMQRVRACDLIENTKKLINSIANHPKDFDMSINDIEVNASVFTNAYRFAEEELKAARESAAGAIAGGVGGAAIAAVTPAAAMWIATTFGTASTGAAISTLSGAAATKAALAWLGGGAVAYGGGGVAAGESMLAMAGPIGIGVAAVTILTTIVIFETKKTSLNKKRKEYIEYINQNTEIIRETTLKIGTLLDDTVKMLNGINNVYTECLPAFGRDYNELDDEMQLRLGSLVNDTKAIAKSLGKTI